MFMQLKVKAKQYANENAKAGSLGNLKFRRIKCYDMMFGILLAIAVSFGAIEKSYAHGGSGTDPVSFVPSRDAEVVFRGGSGNDPAPKGLECLSDSDVRLIKFIDRDNGGGGYDPTDHPGARTLIKIKPDGSGGAGHDPGVKVDIGNESCKLGTLLDYVRQCRGLSNQFCTDVRKQSIQIWRNLTEEQKGLESSWVCGWTMMSAREFFETPGARRLIRRKYTPPDPPELCMQKF